MFQSHPRPFIASIACAPLLMQGCAGGDRGSDPAFDDSEDFPLPAGLESNVAFWRNVYAKWSRRQVASHDNRYLGLIYEVADLPGSIEESYTPAQKDFVRSVKQRWSDRHVARNKERHFPKGVRMEPPLNHHPLVLRYAVTVEDLACHYRVSRSTLASRNLAWQRPVRSGSLPVPAGSTVWLPQGAARVASGQPRPSLF